MSPPHNAVLVTGIGLVSPLSTTFAHSWRRLRLAHSAITLPPPSAPPHLNFAHATVNLPSQPSNLPRSAHLAIHAAQAALLDAHLPSPPPHTGVALGVSLPDLPIAHAIHHHTLSQTARRIPPRAILHLLTSTAAAAVSQSLHLHGPLFSPSTACAAGLSAIADAVAALHRGDAHVMLAGGAESLSPSLIAAFSRTRALAPHHARPFCATRQGFAAAEGAAVLVLETYAHAVARGASAYAQLSSTACTADAVHPTAPSARGDAAFRAMHLALDRANWTPHDVQYVNAHATGTQVGDAAELCALARLFHDTDVVISSSKGATGHMLAAAGAAEAAFTAAAITESFAPPTVGLLQLAPLPDVHWNVHRFLPNAGKRMHISKALCNSFGFGGINVCVAMEQVPLGIVARREIVEEGAQREREERKPQ